MDNSRFSSLVFRIIGKPERWHDDYIDIMHKVLDETESFEDPLNFSELAVGDQILSRLSNTNEALMALNTLLDNSRFKMIILDDSFTIIYRNRNADDLHNYILDPRKEKALNPTVLAKVQLASETLQQKSSCISNNLIATGIEDRHGEVLYLRSVQNTSDTPNSSKPFHLLLAVDQSASRKELNTDLVQRYELTVKEQKILVALTHGRSIRDIANRYFVSENTVRTHVKSLFRKTGTNSQTDIVRLVLTHESQVLDSYFGHNPSAIGGVNYEPSLDRFVTLSNGFKIAYREYGPKDGVPIIVCHNGYGCRVTIPKDYERACKRHNKRIIIPDRPGFGLTPYIEEHPQQWNAMLTEFIDILELEHYELLGTVLGSAMAINFALEADKRLTRLRLSSPVYVNTRRDSDYLIGIFAPVARLVRASKRFTIEIYELWLKSVTLNLAKHYRSMLESNLGTIERALFAENNTIDLMIEGFQQGSSQCLDGISHEMVHCISPQNKDLSQIKIPVDLWWGTQDNRISQAGVENLAAQLPNAKIHIREGFSEYIYYALFDQIIED
jgi:pimeloyl-ACP methyl ester carboxylesterase/DNA-binding CsgD family transcriptional regulator